MLAKILNHERLLLNADDVDGAEMGFGAGSAAALAAAAADRRRAAAQRLRPRRTNAPSLLPI